MVITFSISLGLAFLLCASLVHSLRPLACVALITLALITAFRMVAQGAANQARAQRHFGWCACALVLGGYTTARVAESTSYAAIAAEGDVAKACYAFLVLACFVWARQLMPAPLPHLLVVGTAALWAWSLYFGHAPLVREDHLLTLWTAIIAVVFIGHSIDFHRRMRWISALQYKRDLNEHKRRASEADERAVQAATEVATIATRVQEELAAYVFHELRNDSNATVGLLQCIADSAAAGEAVLPPSVLEMLPDGLAHSHHAVQVCAQAQPLPNPRAH